MGYSGPTTCTDAGNYQHVPYQCVNGKPRFFVPSWINADGSATIVPAAYRAPGVIDQPRPTIVQKGAGGKMTFWTWDNSVGYVDSGKVAEPLVVIDSSGHVTSPGYNPGTGGWQVDQKPDGTAIYGLAPGDAEAIGVAIGQAQIALQNIATALLK